MSANPTTGAERRSIPYLVAAAAAVVLVAVLVGIFGVMRPPILPSIRDAATVPSGSVAWTDWDEKEACAALYVVHPDGDARRVTCRETLGEVVAWTGEGVVTLDWSGANPTLVTFSPDTGEVISSVTSAPGAVEPLDSLVYSERRDGAIRVILDPGRREVWRVDASEGYEVRAGSLSPDGDWVAMVDSAGRLLAMPLDSGGPYVWVDGLSDSTWAPPVWEGTPLHTGDGAKD